MAISSNVTTTGGITIGVSVVEPSGYSESDFTVLQYTTIGQIVDAGSSGKTYNTVAFAPLQSREIFKLRGHYDEGVRTLSLGRDIVDAGQSIVIGAVNSDSLFSFRVLYNNGHVNYFTARVMSYTDDDGAADSIVGSTVNVTNCGETIRNANPLALLKSTSIFSDNASDSSQYTTNDTITVNGTASEDGISTPVVTLEPNTRSTTVTRSGRNFTATYDAVAGDSTALTISIEYDDVDANNARTVTYTTDGSTMVHA